MSPASGTPSPPVVLILGNHRSGTTWLYNLLAETGAVSVLTTSHVIDWSAWTAHQAGAGPRPSEAELAARLKAAGIERRAADGVPVAPNLPVEYGYVLNNAGYPSWLTSKALPLFDTIVRTAAADLQRPVALKNPWDYAGALEVARMVPAARLVFIHRHPLRVIQSGLKAFRMMWRQQDPYLSMLSARYRRNWRRWLPRTLFRAFASGWGGIDLGVFAAGVRRSNLKFMGYEDKLPQDRFINLRYEDLCADPAGQVDRIATHIGITGAGLPKTPPRPRGNTLDPEIAKHKDRICAPMAAYLERWGYTPDGAVTPGPWVGDRHP